MLAPVEHAGDPRHLIVVVEDHDPLREELVDHLSAAGYRVIGLSSPLDIDALLQRERIELFVLDLNLPFEDGLSVARRIRTALPDIGIIALSGRIRSEQKTDAYEHGVDIFLAKPATPNELVAAIKSLSRRLQKPVSAHWSLDRRLAVLHAPDGRSVSLTNAEAALLYSMALAPDRILASTDADLLAIGSKRALESAVSRLRVKLAPLLGGAPSIKVVWGHGYQLLLPVAITAA